ncbi:MAG TPA: FecR domain-containing protein [Chthoniobacterales bacterium]|nr:FecR domain-containing protein [Chthoniobacterales bacterium]
MKPVSKILGGVLSAVAVLLPHPAAVAASSKEARVTQIIREVKLVPSDAAAREAALNDKVSEATGVRTGGESRSELTFPDLTITRLGANTSFSFNKSGRTANVETGSILLRVPKDSGGGTIRSSAVTVAVTGTTVIFEGSRGGRNKLYTLEGSARVALKSKPADWRKVAAGQLLDVPPGATTLPMPVNFDVNQLMQTHPLITDFKPLPSAPLIMAVAQQPPPPTYTGPNVYPVINPPHRGPRPYPTVTPPPVRNPPGTKPPGTTRPPSPETKPPATDTTKPPPTPTAPPIITRTGPQQTSTPKPVTNVPRVQKKKPQAPPGPR